MSGTRRTTQFDACKTEIPRSEILNLRGIADEPERFANIR